MSTETASKLPTHQVSKRSRAPPPPTKRSSFNETENGSQSEHEKDVLKNNGSLGDAGSTPQGVGERQLTLVLPGDKVIKASVAKDTPILDLLIMVSSKNKLNPTGHIIAQPAARTKDPPIHLKSSQMLGDIVGDTVYVIPRNQKELFVYKKEEDKKYAVYEQTTRITIVSSKNHKMILRVDPEKTLQELLPRICDERGVDLSSHSLRLINRPHEPFDLSQTLESTGIIEFLLVDAKGHPAGSELEFMPEPKKKKGSFFGRITKKKKEYEFGGGGGIPEASSMNVTSSETLEQRSRRHTFPSSHASAPSVDAQPASSQEQEDINSNTLKKRRPAPPPPPGKHLTGASDEEKQDQESMLASSNTLRKRRAPPPPRPTSPPRRTQSLDSDTHSESPPRPTSPPLRSEVKLDEGNDVDVHVTDSQEVEQMKQGVSSVQEDKPPRPTKPARPASIIRGSSLDMFPPTEPAEPVFVPPPPPEIPPSPDGVQEDVTKLIEEGRLNQSFDDGVNDEEYGEDKKEEITELTQEDQVDVDLDVAGLTIEPCISKTEDDEEPQTHEEQETHEELEEEQEEAVGDDVKEDGEAEEEIEKDAVEDETSQDVGEQDKDRKAKRELLSHMMEMSLSEDTKETNNYPPNTQAEDTNFMLEEKSVHALAFNITRETTDSQGSTAGSIDGDVEEQDVVKERENVKTEESPKKIKDEKDKPEPVIAEKLNEQYAHLQSQLAALQQQMMMPQQTGMIGMQMQQLQQQMLLQQQMISQMMMSSGQQPMVLPVAYQQPMMSPQQQMVLPQQMVSPQQQMMSPQQQMVSPLQQMISPQQQMVSPQQQMMMMSPQQLMMTPPMMYSQVPMQPSTMLQNTNPQVSSTATVQAQQTPILATHEIKESAVSPKEDIKEITTEVDSSEVDSKDTCDLEPSEPVPRPQSPALKAESYSVGHPTYHFARSRDVPNGEAKVTKASPPNTLRSPKTRQRPSLLMASEDDSLEKNAESDAKVLNEPQPDAQNPPDVSPQVDVNQNPTPEGSIVGGINAIDSVNSKDKRNIPDEKSSISEFAVTGSSSHTETVSPTSEKPKKSGFSLFKKKTPKYSYILSAQREFSRKSETDRQHTSSSPPKAADVKSDTSKGSRGRAHTLDSYDTNNELTSNPAKAEFEKEMKKNVHIPPNVTLSHSNQQPVIPPRHSTKLKQTKDQTSSKLGSSKSTTQQYTSSSNQISSPVNENLPTNTISSNKVSISSISNPIETPTVSKTSSYVAVTSVPIATTESPPSIANKPQVSPTQRVSKEIAVTVTKSPSSETAFPNSSEENPLPPVRKTHTRPNDVSKTTATGEPEGASGPPRRRAKIINLRSLMEEQQKIKADASVSQLRQIFGQGNH